MAIKREILNQTYEQFENIPSSFEYNQNSVDQSVESVQKLKRKICAKFYCDCDDDDKNLWQKEKSKVPLHTTNLNHKETQYRQQQRCSDNKEKVNVLQITRLIDQGHCYKDDLLKNRDFRFFMDVWNDYDAMMHAMAITMK